jgi:hypothetical protein
MFFKTLVLTILLVNNTGDNQLQRGTTMSSSRYETALANKAQYSLWRDLTKGTEMRFHSAFECELPAEKWKLLSSNTASIPEDFVLKYVEKEYVSATDSSHQLLVKIALCESVRSAHEFLFTSLLSITNPAFPFTYSNQNKIGDVYFGGYWARDNLFVCVRSFSSKPIEEKCVSELSALIDANIIALPAENKKIDPEAPRIKEFSIQTKTVPLGEAVAMRVTILDTAYAQEKCRLLFFTKGGRISYKAGGYFYQAQLLGNHDITLYAINPVGKISKCSIAVVAVE